MPTDVEVGVVARLIVYTSKKIYEQEGVQKKRLIEEERVRYVVVSDSAKAYWNRTRFRDRIVCRLEIWMEKQLLALLSRTPRSRNGYYTAEHQGRSLGKESQDKASDSRPSGIR